MVFEIPMKLGLKISFSYNNNFNIADNSLLYFYCTDISNYINKVLLNLQSLYKDYDGMRVAASKTVSPTAHTSDL